MCYQHNWGEYNTYTQTGVGSHYPSLDMLYIFHTCQYICPSYQCFYKSFAHKRLLYWFQYTNPGVFHTLIKIRLPTTMQVNIKSGKLTVGNSNKIDLRILNWISLILISLDISFEFPQIRSHSCALLSERAMSLSLLSLKLEALYWSDRRSLNNKVILCNFWSIFIGLFRPMKKRGRKKQCGIWDSLTTLVRT